MFKTISGVLCVLAAAYVIRVYGFSGSQRPNGPVIVPVIASDQVVELIKAGKKVVFIDAREPEEWKEERIPGAINIALRDVASLDRTTLGNPDLIIAYCLRDFRGFEVAKALQQSGVESASILQELGIRGWKGKGLPTRAGPYSGGTPAIERAELRCKLGGRCGTSP